MGRNRRRLISIALMMMAVMQAVADVGETAWPDLPLLSIVTKDSVMPSRTVVEAPEGCLGTSITNNKYVQGRMVMTLGSDTLYDSGQYVKNESGMRIKIRGNSTGAFSEQLPYRIELSKEADLLMRSDNNLLHKEWVLLMTYVWNPKLSNSQSNLLNAVGNIVSHAVEKEWTQQWQFVNVVINGSYQGLYYLLEPVSQGKGRVDVSETGFLIEYDPFWWNEDGFYFKSEHQPYTYSYTYRYPDKDYITDSTRSAIQSYINDFEKALYDGGDPIQYIDLASFVKWVLAHDILGTDDDAGCNKYLYKNNLLPGDSLSSKLCMGPLWDFDSSFRISNLKWSSQHTMEEFYYSRLFEQEAFVEAYVDQWLKIRPTLLDSLQSAFNEIGKRYSTSFDESIKMQMTLGLKYQRQKLLSTQISEIMRLLTARVSAIDNLMMEFDYYRCGISDVSQQKYVPRVYSLHGYVLGGGSQRSPGIYLYRSADGSVRKRLK